MMKLRMGITVSLTGTSFDNISWRVSEIDIGSFVVRLIVITSELDIISYFTEILWYLFAWYGAELDVV